MIISQSGDRSFLLFLEHFIKHVNLYYSETSIYRSRIHRFLSGPPTKTMNRGFTVLLLDSSQWHLSIRPRAHHGNWQPQHNRSFRELLSAGVEHMLVNGAAQTEDIALPFSSICAAPFSNMCSTQADNNSRKLRLRCGCQLPWCALARRVLDLPRENWVVLVSFPPDTISKLKPLCRSIYVRLSWSLWTARLTHGSEAILENQDSNTIPHP
jgi:hypothetical protein